MEKMAPAATVRTIDEALTVRDGRLFVEHCDAVELAKAFGTPIHVVSEDQLRRNARRFTAAFAQRWPEGPVRVLPSLKANFSLAVRRVLSSEGLGCDTFGIAELTGALRAGVAPSLISVNGSVKTPELIERAIEAGARITLDAARELDVVEETARHLGRVATVRLRLRPAFPELQEPTDLVEAEEPTAEAIRMYKAGIPTADALELGPRAIASDAVDLAGLHVHVPRHRRETEAWRVVVSGIVALVSELSRAWGGWLPRELDLGGGYAAPRDPTGRLFPRLDDRDRSAPSIEEYAEVVTDTLRTELARRGLPADGLTLEIEPGRGLHADTGIHLATVRNVKREADPVPWRWVETDTTEMFLPDSMIEHNRWPVIVANRADAPPAGPADVVGMSCGFDLMVPQEPLPELREGDLLAFLDTGAYQDASASNFNALPRPATVLVRGDEAEVVKRAETIDDVFARDVVPARLAGGS
jgi:diaminopimelate decarboxylase